MVNNKSNLVGLYFEDNIGVFNKQTCYNPRNKNNFLTLDDYDKWLENQPERLFWSDETIENPFITKEFYYAEINHPTMGKAIYRKRKNGKYIWQFENEKDVKISMRSSIGEQYKDMINDGYIVIKKGHNKITAD